MLEGLRSGVRPSLGEVRAFGDACPDQFFRDVIEPLCDSFSEDDAAAYSFAMGAWIEPVEYSRPVAPLDCGLVYVLSRVTLGSDIKLTSVILDAMKRRYPAAEIVLVGSAKAAELFAGDARVSWMPANYPRSGTVETRLTFLRGLRLGEGIVIDPDSRLTQLGLALPCEASRYFHFPSRVYGAETGLGLGALLNSWLIEKFGVGGTAYVAPAAVDTAWARPCVAVSLGVGGNEAKRLGGDFEGELLRRLGARYATVLIDRGAGGEERERVDRAAEFAGIRAVYCEGSFAEFAAAIRGCDAYVGYDSAGQHAAAALGVPVTTIFTGAPNERFRLRWRPEGAGAVRVIAADGLSMDRVLEEALLGAID